MFRNVVITTALFVLVAIAAPGQTNAQDISTALKRMDEIIAEMQKLRTEFAALQSQVSGTSVPTPAVQGSSSGKTLTMDLSYGETNEDIARIQRLLATDPEIYDHPYVTGFFGPKTEEAIRNFQTRFGLDPVGIIGPATTALLEVFFNAYPDENYPAGVLDKKPTPTVQGAATSVTPTTPTITSPSSNPASSIVADYDRGEAKVRITYQNGNRTTVYAMGDSESEIIRSVASKTPLSEAQVSAVIEFDGLEDDSSSNDGDENDAEDAIDDADEAIDDADDEIDAADKDGDDVDWAEDTLREAKDLLEEAEEAFEDEDWDEAIEKAEEAEDLAKEAEDRIDEEEGSSKGDNDEIDSIEADVVDEDETEITVEYDNGDEDYEFTVEEDKKDEIIEEVADELDMDEDDVEDLIEFDYGDIDSIDAFVDEDENETKVTIEFESGVTMHLVIDSDDEDDVIEEVADELDEDEDDIEDLIDFDY